MKSQEELLFRYKNVVGLSTKIPRPFTIGVVGMETFLSTLSLLHPVPGGQEEVHQTMWFQWGSKYLFTPGDTVGATLSFWYKQPTEDTTSKLVKMY